MKKNQKFRWFVAPVGGFTNNSIFDSFELFECDVSIMKTANEKSVRVIEIDFETAKQIWKSRSTFPIEFRFYKKEGSGPLQLVKKPQCVLLFDGVKQYNQYRLKRKLLNMNNLPRSRAVKK